MAVTDWNAATRAELADMEREGVTSFKAYMAYENLRLGDRELLALFEATADIGVVGVHCELGDEVKTRVARLLAAGKTGPEWHPRSRPNEVESAGRAALPGAGARGRGRGLGGAPEHARGPGRDRDRAAHGPARAGGDLLAVPHADRGGLRAAEFRGRKVRVLAAHPLRGRPCRALGRDRQGRG